MLYNNTKYKLNKFFNFEYIYYFGNKLYKKSKFYKRLFNFSFFFKTNFNKTNFYISKNYKKLIFNLMRFDKGQFYNKYSKKKYKKYFSIQFFFITYCLKLVNNFYESFNNTTNEDKNLVDLIYVSRNARWISPKYHNISYKLRKNPPLFFSLYPYIRKFMIKKSYRRYFQSGFYNKQENYFTHYFTWNKKIKKAFTFTYYNKWFFFLFKNINNRKDFKNWYLFLNKKIRAKKKQYYNIF